MLLDGPQRRVVTASEFGPYRGGGRSRFDGASIAAAGWAKTDAGDGGQHRSPDRRGRVAGEIAEDLAAEGQRRHPGIEYTGHLLSVKDQLCSRAQETISQHVAVKST